MSVIEFFTNYWDWYLLIGVVSACRYLPVRWGGGQTIELIIFCSWDVVTWPSDLLRSLRILNVVK